MHDRERLYRRIYSDYCDRHGMLRVTQLKLADELDLPYQRLSVIFSELVRLGYMKKFRNRWQLKDPDTLVWGKEFKKLRRGG